MNNSWVYFFSHVRLLPTGFDPGLLIPANRNKSIKIYRFEGVPELEKGMRNALTMTTTMTNRPKNFILRTGMQKRTCMPANTNSGSSLHPFRTKYSPAPRFSITSLAMGMHVSLWVRLHHSHRKSPKTKATVHNPWQHLICTSNSLWSF